MSEDRMKRALLALDGLSVGDALGERFFVEDAPARIRARALPESPCHYTDDTEMALGILDVLRARGRIDQDLLAATFARRYAARPWRGYGGAAHQILREVGEGAPWRETARRPFGGEGSCGNGGAMRVAPLGAWFADDLARAAAEARASSEVTHAHPDGQAGAVAVAVAAAVAVRGASTSSRELFAAVLEHVPEGNTRRGIERAARFPADATPEAAALELGSGSRVLSEDTVPFVLWSAARRLGSYEEAFWETLAGLGDRDTTCAMVGGIVALSSGSVPEAWVQIREPLT